MIGEDLKMSIGKNFPISEYYKSHILDGRTINRSGVWWSAILLIKDPKTEKPFLAFYRWQKKEGDWKVRKSFNCRKRDDAVKIIEIVNEFSANLS